MRGATSGHGGKRELRSVLHERPPSGVAALAGRAPGRQIALEERSEESEYNWRSDARYILESTWFDVSIGAIIAVNAAIIGIEQTLQLQGRSTIVTSILESSFLVIYIGELTLRLVVLKRKALLDSWVRFDVLLVFLGVLGSWIVDPFVTGEAARVMAPVMVLRMMRLLRLAKTLRLFSRVQECWMLVRGFMNSFNILVYSFLILFIMLYIFSCLAVELITKRRGNGSSEYQEHVDRYFSNLPHAMLTLIRFVCLDNTSEVYQPLVEQEPMLSIFFVLIMFTLSIVMFHLLGSVIFSSTLDQNASELDQEKIQKEDEWAQLITDLKAMFTRMDEDKSGNLSKEEVMNIAPLDQRKLTQALGLQTPMQVFNALDVDRSGEVSISEFFDGIWEIVVQRSDISLKRMEKQIEAMHWRAKENFKVVHDMQVQITNLAEQIETLRMETTGGLLPGRPRSESGDRSPRTSVLLRSPRAVAASSRRLFEATSPGRGPVLDMPEKVQSKTAAMVESVTGNLRCMWEEVLETTLASVRAAIERSAADAAATVEQAERLARRASRPVNALSKEPPKKPADKSRSPPRDRPASQDLVQDGGGGGGVSHNVPKLKLQSAGLSSNGSATSKPSTATSAGGGSSSPKKAPGSPKASGTAPAAAAGQGIASSTSVLGRGFGPPPATEAKDVPPAERERATSGDSGPGMLRGAAAEPFPPAPGQSQVHML